jgi:PAS domain S-box-containing protein
VSALVDETGCPTLLVDDDGFVLRANRSFADFSGYEIGEINGKKWNDFIDGDGRENITRGVLSSLARSLERRMTIYGFSLAGRSGSVSDLSIELKSLYRGFLAFFRILPDSSRINGEGPRDCMSFVDALMKMMRARDPETAFHEEQVAVIAEGIAVQMGLSADECEGIRVASLVHDAGKITMPFDIISKETPLNERERAFVREHPRLGYEIISHIPFPWPVAMTVIQHHERLDGSGYPYGLSGNSICTGARVIAVADTFSAMTSPRAHRPAIDKQWALAELYAGRGIKYDSAVIDALARSLAG